MDTAPCLIQIVYLKFQSGLIPLTHGKLLSELYFRKNELACSRWFM
jgi:hypothetical protein